ncbi:unnamed protein product [Acanthoscelides obtectus]|uniref:Uridine diphosphate glucose pyrophosphatase NUDT14 n=1 Tax=Acanthoscelides obtectus TaxID=200917 RepID=A0A9P0JME5_ACAOB|nr:unnamed protein product [Acanthoscelides obtectus]CAK1655061.1 Uridine diphosphate glucose pyrophosphatase [Acanthoscelides obtectus]
MEDLSEVHLTEYIPTIYTSPRTIYYTQNGKQRKWHIMAERNGVVIVLYNSTRDVLILVKQFRASAYIHQIPEEERTKKPIDVKKYPPNLGITYEFCAGLEDKNISTAETAREEILEECGYEVTLDQLEKIATIKNLSETTGARSTFYYCEVTDEMRLNHGGGNEEEGENIEVVEMPVEEVLRFTTNREYVPCPINFMFGLYWFLNNKYHTKYASCYSLFLV